jgi:hypothetical protein
MNLFKIISEIHRLRKQNTKLAVQNIILRSDLRTISEDPESPKAKPIITKYKKELEIEREIEQASQN